MVTVNLLPWRLYEKNYQKMVLKWLFGVTLSASLCLTAGLHYFLSSRMSALHDRVVLLKKEVNVYSSRMKDILPVTPSDAGKLSRRLDIKQILFEFVRQPIPEVCLTAIKRQGNEMGFSGYARSPADLTNFLASQSLKQVFSVIRIKKIKRHNHLFQFDVETKEIKKAAKCISIDGCM